MQLMPLVASVHTYHKCLQHNTMCRAQQHAAVVAAHDRPWAALCASLHLEMPHSFLHDVFVVCSSTRCRWSICKGVCPAAQKHADAAITTAFPLQVTTKRVQNNRKLVWPCLRDPVEGLEGCGTSTCKKLADTYAHAAELGVSVPEHVPMRQKITTGQLYSHAFFQTCSPHVPCLQVCCVSKCDACCFRSFATRHLYLQLHIVYSICRLLIFSTANSLYDDKSTIVQFPGCALIEQDSPGRQQMIMKPTRGLQRCVSTVQLVEEFDAFGADCFMLPSQLRSSGS